MFGKRKSFEQVLFVFSQNVIFSTMSDSGRIRAIVLFLKQLHILLLATC